MRHDSNTGMQTAFQRVWEEGGGVAVAPAHLSGFTRQDFSASGARDVAEHSRRSHFWVFDRPTYPNSALVPDCLLCSPFSPSLLGCLLIYVLAQADLSLLPKSKWQPPPSHTPHPPTSLHVCVYERVRIIAHQLSSLMGLISINITVERTFALQQPAILTNPSSWQWVPGGKGGLHNCLTGFFSFFRVAERQKPQALFELQWFCVVKVQEYMREREERFPWRYEWKSCRREKETPRKRMDRKPKHN